MKNITLRQIRVFISVAEHLHFNRAAAELHLTPAAVSLQMKQLEEYVGQPLFEREAKQTTLTTAGEYMLAYAKRIVKVLREAEDVFSRLRRNEGGRLTVGIVSTAKYFMPHLLARFRAEHPNVAVDLFVDNREGLLRALKEHRVDLAIMGSPPRDLSASAEPFALHPLVLVASPEHPWTHEANIPVTALNNVDFCIREQGSGCRIAVEQFLLENDLKPHIVLEITSNEIVKQSIMANMGVGIVSLHTVGLELQHQLLKIVPMSSLPLMRSWHVVHMQSKTLSLPAEALRYFIIEHGESYFARHPVFSSMTRVAMAGAPPIKVLDY